jgi:hypothetical protein
VTAAEGAPAALARLATALGAQFSTTLVHRAGRRPHLTVADRHTQAATEVYADDRGRYQWPWAEPAAVTGDPLTAARQITAILRGDAPDGGPAVTGAQAGEPTLADVQQQFPGWRCQQGTNRLYHATHTSTGTRVHGEDPLDLRDQIGAAERLRA